MPTRITYTLNVEVNGATTVEETTGFSVEGYDDVVVTVPAHDETNPGEISVDVQPSSSDKIRFLLIESSVYDANLKYSVNGGTEDIALDSMQLFAGSGALDFLGADPKVIEFSNGSARDAKIRIIVGRQITST